MKIMEKIYSSTILFVFILVACDIGNNQCIHNWGEWLETSAPKITQELMEVDGVETRTCSKCSEIANRAITFKSYFYGTWERQDYLSVTLTPTEIEFNATFGDFSGYFVKGTIISWEPIISQNQNHIDDGYVTGYNISFAVTQVDDLNEDYEVGDIDNNCRFFLHIDRQSLQLGIFGSNIYIKN